MSALGPRYGRAPAKVKVSVSDAQVRARGLRVPPQTREEFRLYLPPRHARQDDMDSYAQLPSRGGAGKIF